MEVALVNNLAPPIRSINQEEEKSIPALENQAVIEESKSSFKSKISSKKGMQIKHSDQSLKLFDS